MIRIENINGQNFVNFIRAKINLQISSLIDSFSGWLIGGFGAAATLLVSQYELISKHIDAHEIQRFLIFFILALVTAIFQKYIAIIIKASSIGCKMKPSGAIPKHCNYYGNGILGRINAATPSTEAGIVMGQKLTSITLLMPTSPRYTNPKWQKPKSPRKARCFICMTTPSSEMTATVSILPPVRTKKC